MVLHAYLEWGTSFLSRLRGMFALALWDGRRQELVLARDRLGVKPLFYYQLPDGLLFGSEPKALAASGMVPWQVDEDGLRELVSSIDTPGHAVIRGMREVLPGHVLRVGRSGVSVSRYWRLDARPHVDDLPTTIDMVRELLTSAVAEHLIADVPLGALLSGGLDSSVVAALAVQAMDGRTLRTFTIDPHRGGADFSANRIWSSSDTPFARCASLHLGTDHVEVPVRPAELDDPDLWTAVIEARDLPFGAGNNDVS